MGFVVRDGKLGFGLEPARITLAGINRGAAASVTGNLYMCDTANTSYDLDADEGGVFGNFIVPTADATWTQNIVISPIACALEAGIAVGSPMRLIAHGTTQVLCSAGGAVARGHIHVTSASHVATPIVNGSAATVRAVGFTNEAYTAGTVLLKCYFTGIGKPY